MRPATIFLALLGSPMLVAGSAPLNACLINAVGPLNVAFPSYPLYQQADVRVYNLNLPVTPAAVASPETAQQVSKVIQCANQYGYKVSAAGGRHSYANFGLGGQDGHVVVAMQNFDGFDYDPVSQTAQIGAGNALGSLTQKLQNVGRAMAYGICPTIGVGGHFGIGGLGPLSRQYGTGLDQVLEVEAVLANSSIVNASSTENPDLFFAVRGASASFAIVTNYKAVTQPSPQQIVRYQYNITTGNAQDYADAFKSWQQLISAPTLDRRLASTFTLTPYAAIITGNFYGPRADFDSINLQSRIPFIGNAEVDMESDLLSALANLAEEGILELAATPTPFYAKSVSFTNETLLSDSEVDSIFSNALSIPNDALTWFVVFDLEGGKTNDIAEDATAYAHRNDLVFAQIYAIDGSDNDATTQGFVANVTNSMLDGARVANGIYPGYVDLTLANAQQAYWGSNYPRLQSIKNAVDPTQVFSNPQSVRPA